MIDLKFNFAQLKENEREKDRIRLQHESVASGRVWLRSMSTGQWEDHAGVLERKLKLGQWAITQQPEKCLPVMAIEQAASKKG